jgi:hypothetical protein
MPAQPDTLTCCGQVQVPRYGITSAVPCGRRPPPPSAAGLAGRPRSGQVSFEDFLASRIGASALMMRRDDKTNDQDERSGRKYQDHREDVLEDPVLACYPLPVFQRHPGLRWMIAGGRIVQVESSAAPAQAVSWVPLRATNPNHHASLPPLCGQCSAVQVSRKDRSPSRNFTSRLEECYPPDGMNRGVGHPSVSPSSRARATAWLRVAFEDPAQGIRGSGCSAG